MKNPSAFPLHPEHWQEENQGMSLRDYFAAKAMQGLLADPNTPEIMDIAGAAYEVADAMLAEREKA